MKKTIIVYIFSFFLVIFIMGACDSNTSTNEANQTAEAAPDSALAEENEEEPLEEEEDLVLLAYMNNRMQHQMSEIAAANTQTESVRELAESIMQTEREIQVRIQELAQASNKTLPEAITPEQVSKIDSLQKLPEEAFDEAYLNKVVEEYKLNSERLDALMVEGDNAMTRGLITDIKDKQDESLRKAASLLEELS